MTDVVTKATPAADDAEAAADRKAIANRLKRAQGQLAAVIAMVEDNRECRDVLTQLSAVSRAIDRAGYKIVASTMRGCVNRPDESSMTPQELEELFLKLA
ncbi:metal-sensing transcriptional repressor [Corynebacterium ulceribovis]|uniref:metal-sensitive transcriptional regulator n=1 Tax=Corynebacterium ulceribovis TaxID=487732 RepID=UPI0003635428